jgi:hypothetical protein
MGEGTSSTSPPTPRILGVGQSDNLSRFSGILWWGFSTTILLSGVELASLLPRDGDVNCCDIDDVATLVSATSVA